MKRYFSLIAFLLVFFDSPIVGDTGNAPKIAKLSGYTDESQIDIVIYYGLNESHSKSWVRENADGVIGITYFQRFQDSFDEGILLYKTINRDGSTNVDSVATGQRLEKSVLLYDAMSNPHIFVARSNNYDQIIGHYYKDGGNQWQIDTITHFYNAGGRFIYELSAETGPDNSFHLLILKSRSDIDSDDYWFAWLDSYLYHFSNASGVWKRQLIHNYNMAYTYDHYIKSSSRQDIKIDKDGYVHVIFSEQIDADDDPSRLLYATNKTGVWQIEVALNYDYGIRDDAGWFPSLCLDKNGIPYISCMYVNRVYTYSAVYCKLYYLKRLGSHNWQAEVIAEYDDGYYGGDGRNYTGALSHLVIDNDNTPHIIFSDIASTHWTYQRLNVGNIRYGVFREGVWDFKTIYRQSLPTGFLNAAEMHGICLVVSELTDTIRVIGQELEVSAEDQYSCRLVEFALENITTNLEDEPRTELPEKHHLSQNNPNPFNLGTSIVFNLSRKSRAGLTIYNVLGQQINKLIDGELPAGNHSVYWDGDDFLGSPVSTGIYFYRLEAGDFAETKKMLLLK